MRRAIFEYILNSAIALIAIAGLALGGVTLWKLYTMPVDAVTPSAVRVEAQEATTAVETSINTTEAQNAAAVPESVSAEAWVEPTYTPPRYAASEEELIMLARLAHFEGNSTKAEMEAICEVVLNRKEGGKWPGTIEGVIMQQGMIGGRLISQFHTAHTAAFAEYEPTAEEYDAARAVCYDNASVVGPGVEYFDAAGAPAGKIASGLALAGVVGKSAFYEKMR